MTPTKIYFPVSDLELGDMDVNALKNAPIISEYISDYVTTNYPGVEEYGLWEIKDDIVVVSDVAWAEDNFEEYVEQIRDLDLDDDAYDYYLTALEDIHFHDKISAKNGCKVYKSYEDVLCDAISTAEGGN